MDLLDGLEVCTNGLASESRLGRRGFPECRIKVKYQCLARLYVDWHHCSQSPFTPSKVANVDSQAYET